MMEPRSNGRLALTMVVLSILAVLVWKTMEPGKFQYLTWILLGFFAFRVVIMSLAARYSKDEAAKRLDWETSSGERESLPGVSEVPKGRM
jgi:type VI protein secretion system component VasK